MASEPTLIELLEESAADYDKLSRDFAPHVRAEARASRLREAAGRLRSAFEGVSLGDELAKFSTLDLLRHINGGPLVTSGAGPTLREGQEGKVPESFSGPASPATGMEPGQRCTRQVHQAGDHWHKTHEVGAWITAAEMIKRREPDVDASWPAYQRCPYVEGERKP